MKLKSSTYKKNKFAVLLAFSGIIILSTLLITLRVSAQGGDVAWTQPYRLSSEAGEAGDEVVFADQFGYVHLFWPETGLLDHQTILYYSRFDGENWTLPVDILIGPAATNVAAAVDEEGFLHLVFTNGGNGDVYYTNALIRDAVSAKGWQPPRRLGISARSIAFKVDSNGVYHLLYSGYSRNEPGVYYINSADNGVTWSRSVWLDTHIPPDLTPKKIQLEIAEENSLHAAWSYWDWNFIGRSIHYAHSFDQGQNWSVPFTVDEVEAGNEELKYAEYTMVVNGRSVYLIWVGGDLAYRRQRISSDLGRTWDQVRYYVFGDLHGMAIGDGLALDALGRSHFIGQIRWPQGIYHAYWSQGRWSTPSMIYLIIQNSNEPIDERIHAHRVRVAIRAGNQLVVTFTTSPNDPQSILYAMHMTMSDVPALEDLPLPEQTLVPTTDPGSELPSTTSSPEIPTDLPDLDIFLDAEPSEFSTPSSGLIWGIIPVILLIAGVITFRFLLRRNG